MGEATGIIIFWVSALGAMVVTGMALFGNSDKRRK